jgi:hypothetical protein
MFNIVIQITVDRSRRLFSSGGHALTALRSSEKIRIHPFPQTTEHGQFRQQAPRSTRVILSID